MAYYSDKATDDEIKALEKEIAEVYKQASQDVANTSAKYFANFEDRYAKEYAAYLKGEGGYSDPTTAKQKFDSWYLAQVGRGEKWDKLQEQLAQRMTDANKVAAAYINDKTPGVYSLNANYEAYQIYNSTGIDFNLVDEQTVKGLMTGKTKILPESRVASTDEEWNERQLSRALLGGILQGKGIGDIATSFQSVANMDRTSALRNARTSVTNAQNAGRQATYEAAKEMGIDIKKEWIATEDDRTRESHAELDGVQVDYDEEFPNGLMYPGDPKGDPSEVYNCRCTMRAIIPKYNGQQRTSEIEGHEGDHTKETYDEWLKRKEEEKAEKEKNQKPWTSAQASAEAMEAKEDKLPEATDRKSANELLTSECNLKIDDTTKKINEELYVANTNQLIKLEDRFGACHDALNPSIIAVNDGRAEAYVSNPTVNPLSMKLSLCPKYFDNYEDHLIRVENAVDADWSMPCAKENYAIYNVTHEYGHILENIFIADYYKANGWNQDNPREFYQGDKKTKDARVRWYTKNADACAKGIFTEIVDIAKKNNSDFKLSDNLSEYGKSNYYEAFAEVFANSQLGEPNELGQAMEEWLQSKGY